MSVMEIEQALRQLPPQKQLEIAERLLEELQEMGQPVALSEKKNPQLPDYSLRRRRIFGNKVLPNMVLVAREEERW